MTYSKEIVREWLDQVAERAKEYPEWVDVFERCYTDTLDNTVEILEDGSTFVLTGDIPAMWLRDSTAQLRPYLHVAKRDPRLRQTIAGLVKRQMTSRIPMLTLLILRRTGKATTRPTTPI
jgi:meiotically up-regulated gene 157 (Mug157) protein